MSDFLIILAAFGIFGIIFVLCIIIVSKEKRIANLEKFNAHNKKIANDSILMVCDLRQEKQRLQAEIKQLKGD